MASLVFPVELWLDILPLACQDDGTVGVSLSCTSRGLRSISKPYRYQSVQIKGWRQLLLFEKHFSQVPDDEQRIVNLYVDLEHVLEAGYPGAPMWAPENSDSDDESYLPSEDEAGDIDEAEGLDGSYSEGEDTESRDRDMEEEIEFAPISETERSELEDDLHNRRRTRGCHSLFLDALEIQTFVDLQRSVNIQSRQAEGHAYAALRRLLEACANSLEFLTLCWSPATCFMGEELFPKMHVLRSLVCWTPRTESRSGPLPFMGTGRIGLRPSALDTDKYRITRGLALFPSLRRLEFSRQFDIWFSEMPVGELDLEYASVFCDSNLVRCVGISYPSLLI